MPLLYKIPEGSKELQDKELVNKLIAESAEICGHLGDLFTTFKSQAAQGFVGYAGIGVVTSPKELKELQMKCFYTALLQPFYKYQVPHGHKKALQSVA